MCSVLHNTMGKIHMTRYRNSCKCDNTLMVMLGRGLGKNRTFNFETSVIWSWGVKSEVGQRPLVVR